MGFPGGRSLLVVACALTAPCVGRAGERPRAASPVTDAPAMRVRLRLDVSGELVAPAGPDAAAERRPVAMEARFDFDETSTAVSSTAVSSTAGAEPRPAAAVVRRYADATAEIRAGDRTARRALAPDARSVLVARIGTTPMPFLADGFLSGDEADLLDTPFDPLLLEGLLPATQVVVGDTWHVAGDVAAGLLAIDTVESGTIDARLEEVADGVAVVSLSGIVDGAADGVPTHVTIEGTLSTAARRVPVDDDRADAVAAPAERFELWGPVARIGATVRERRQASHVAPGFDLEARLALAQAPIAAADVRDPAARPADPAEVGMPAPRRRGAGMPGRIWHRDPAGRFDLVRDARWRVVEDGPGGLVMRLIDRGALVAQCSVTALDLSGAAPAPPTVADLERDVQRSLTGQVLRTEAGAELAAADGTRIVRVASSGTAGGLPFQWIHYVLTAADGSRVNVTFMFESSLRGRFADADTHLIGGVRAGRADRVARRAAADDGSGR